MQIDLLRNIVSSIVGNSASAIVDLLYDKKNVNEFLISKKLNLTINQTRNILYKLSDEGLVSFVRKKDNKKGGWYTYYWTLNSGKSLEKFRGRLLQELENIKNQKNIRANGRFYHCPNCDLEFTEEAALLQDYLCTECGEVLQLRDNSEIMKGLDKDIQKRENLIVSLDQEINIIHSKDQKTKERKLKAEKKKKQEERAMRKKVRDKEKAKMNKISSKKNKVKKKDKAKNKNKKGKKTSKKR